MSSRQDNPFEYIVLGTAITGVSLGGANLSSANGHDDTIGITQVEDESLEVDTVLPLSKIYWNHLDADWAANTQTTVAVFTTPAASVGGQSLNPLSQVDEENFVTADGAKYLEESGIRESAGLGPNLSWLITPAEVASRSITFLGNQTTMTTYVGYVTTDDSDIPRTVLVNLAKTETGDDIAFGVSVQHRAMYNLGGTDATEPTDALLSGVSVPDLVGSELSSGILTNAGEEATLILENGVAASADRAATAIGSLSLA